MDAFPLVAFLRADEPVASAVRVLLQEEECATTSLNLAETFDVCCRVYRIPARDVDKALEPLLDDQLLVRRRGSRMRVAPL